VVDKRFLGCLGCTGVAAIVVLLFPAAALFGYFMGIVPGIFLGLSPSLFVYLVAWWGLRGVVLKIESLAGFDLNARMIRWTANIVAIAIVAAFAIVTPLAINAPLQQQIAELQATDVQLPGTIKLPAVVAIELPKSYAGGKGKPPYCEGLCLRLLFNGVVSRVIAAEIRPDGNIEPASSYRIERRDQCPQLDFTALPIVWPGERWVEKGKPAGIENRVRARISAGECLVREVGRIEDAEAVISFRELKKGLARFRGPWTLPLDTVSAKRLEIIETGGRVLYRRTEVTAEPLIVPLITTAQAGLLTTVTYSGWARATTEASPLGPNGRDVLPGLLGDAARPPDFPDTARPQ
jgi:hypothetical protein